MTSHRSWNQIKAERDYRARMLDKVNQTIPDWDYVPAIVAQTVVEQLEAEDPQLLFGWLHSQAVELVTNMIADLARERKRVEQTSAVTLRFAELVKQDK